MCWRVNPENLLCHEKGLRSLITISFNYSSLDTTNAMRCYVLYLLPHASFKIISLPSSFPSYLYKALCVCSDRLLSVLYLKKIYISWFFCLHSYFLPDKCLDINDIDFTAYHIRKHEHCQKCVQSHTQVCGVWPLCWLKAPPQCARQGCCIVETDLGHCFFYYFQG